VPRTCVLGARVAGDLEGELIEQMPGQKAPERERRKQIFDAALRAAVKRRLAGLTIRDVAKEAGLSTGLVLFHFKSRDGLIRALLDWLLHQNAVLRPNASGRGDTNDCLGEFIRDECTRLVNSRQRTELFFDFWVAGTRRPGLRQGMRAALVRYRQEFRALAAEALKQHCPAPSGLTADAVDSAAVSSIHGCAIQAVMDPGHFRLDAALAVIDALGGEDRVRTRTRSARAAPRPAIATVGARYGRRRVSSVAAAAMSAAHRTIRPPRVASAAAARGSPSLRSPASKLHAPRAASATHVFPRACSTPIAAIHTSGNSRSRQGHGQWDPSMREATKPATANASRPAMSRLRRSRGPIFASATTELADVGPDMTLFGRRGVCQRSQWICS
jgi:TetR/AcrR family transcriptional regulator, transcriptional repressor of bet genes